MVARPSGRVVTPRWLGAPVGAYARRVIPSARRVATPSSWRAPRRPGRRPSRQALSGSPRREMHYHRGLTHRFFNADSGAQAQPLNAPDAGAARHRR